VPRLTATISDPRDQTREFPARHDEAVEAEIFRIGTCLLRSSPPSEEEQGRAIAAVGSA